jgi:Mg-chelatase subunit ChlD
MTTVFLRGYKQFLCFLLAVVLLCGLILPVSAKPTVVVSPAYNVVFVMDASLSLRDSDPVGMRDTGLATVLALVVGTGSRVGLVTFNRTAAAYEPKLRQILSPEDVQSFYIAAQQKLGEWTNIVEALRLANRFFTEENGADPALPNLILLFTDGEIDLPGGKSNIETSYQSLGAVYTS